MSEGDDDCGSNNTEYDDDATGPQYASSEAHDGFEGYPSRMTQSWSQSPSYVPHPEFVQNDEGGSDYDDEEDDDTVPQYPVSDGYTSFETTQSRSTPNDGEAEDPVCDWDVFSFESNPEETNRTNERVSFFAECYPNLVHPDSKVDTTFYQSSDGYESDKEEVSADDYIDWDMIVHNDGVLFDVEEGFATLKQQADDKRITIEQLNNYNRALLFIKEKLYSKY